MSEVSSVLRGRKRGIIIQDEMVFIAIDRYPVYHFLLLSILEVRNLIIDVLHRRVNLQWHPRCKSARSQNQLFLAISILQEGSISIK